MTSSVSLSCVLPIDDDLSVPLSDEQATRVIQVLERAVNAHRFNEPDCSVQIAQQIIDVGTLRNNDREIALGMMLLADSLAQRGDGYQASWDMLDTAAGLYERHNDHLGWARTRIGRLLLCYDLGQVETAFEDAEKAEQILQDHNQPHKLMALRANVAYVYNYQGKYQAALNICEHILSQAVEMGAEGDGYIAPLCRTIGYSYSYLGDLDMAWRYYQQAYDHDVGRNRQGADVARLSMAHIARARGDYREALRLLSTDIASSDIPNRVTLQLKITRTELDLELNRYDSALELAQEVVRQSGTIKHQLYQALGWILVGQALVGLLKYSEAGEAFTQAETLFKLMKSDTWLAMAELYLGLVALRQHDIETACRAIDVATERFVQDQRFPDLTQARLLQAEVLLLLGDLKAARAIALEAIRLATELDVPLLKYQAFYLLGHIAEEQKDIPQAMGAYRKACEVIWDVQSILTLTLRPDFMKNRDEAAHALIRLLLNQGSYTEAFEIVERMKAQIMLSEFTNRANLRWQRHSETAQKMVKALEMLRAQHHYTHRLLSPSPLDRAVKDPNLTKDQRTQLEGENARRELEMQRLTERLYLEASLAGQHQLIDLPTPAHIRAALPKNTTMLAYYSDGESLWGFIINGEIKACRLVTVKEYTYKRDVLDEKMVFALDQFDNPTQLANITRDTQVVLHDLYRDVMAPLCEGLAEKERLIIVPYGLLHDLPFSALHDGRQYLMQRHNLTILPAASLVTRTHTTPHHTTMSARVIGHSWYGTLPSVIKEARLVHKLCSGEIYLEKKATVSALQNAACKILHISAHGEFRTKQTHNSFIQLEDGQLYIHDLLQNDMQYQLVVLSACQTGLSDKAAGDELLGLERGFLYAGTGAVLKTLWYVESTHTLELMRHFYKHILEGRATNEALCLAQEALIANPASQHPLFWSLFQLTGLPEVLV